MQKLYSAVSDRFYPRSEIVNFDRHSFFLASDQIAKME